MSETWDAIVIGAGIGGLTAAAYLVRAGKRVLVLDRNPHPGGTAYVYHRKGFSFPMGPLGFSSPEIIQNILDDLGGGKELHFSRVHYRIRAFGLDLPVSLPFSELVLNFSASFPPDAPSSEKFFKMVQDLGEKNSGLSASDYLHEHIKDWRLRRILGSIGTKEPYSSLPLLIAMWNLMSREGIWYPREGMASFCQRLGRVLPPCGEVRLNKHVTRIRVDHGRVVGVTLRNGMPIDAHAVISNADYKQTFLKLINSTVLPPGWYQTVSEARQTGSIFQVCLGVDLKKADFSLFEEADRVIYKRPGGGDDPPNWSDREVAPGVFASQELEVSLWGRNDRTVAPRGEAVIVIRTEAEYSHFTRFRSPNNRRISEYHDYKNRLGQSLIHEIEDLMPGIGSAILERDIATPLTFENQGGRSGGAVAGWSWDYEDFKDNQPKELIRTPIRGLYMAGYQAFSALFMGGVPTAMESGKRAAKAVFENADPVDEILIPLSPSLPPETKGEG